MPMHKLQVERKVLKVQNVVGEKAKQVNIINDVEFPVKVKKIYDTTVRLEDVETDIISGKVVIEGTIHKQVYYVVEETCEVDGILYEAGEVYEQTVEEDFSEFIEIPGARPGMTVDVQCRVEYVDWNDIGPEEIECGEPDLWRQTLVCELYAKVTEVVEIEVVVDVDAPGLHLDVIKEPLTVEAIVGENRKQTEVLADIEFPEPVKKIKNVTAKVKDIETNIIPNKIVIEGVLHKQIYYVAIETGQLKELSVDEKFTVWVEVPGAVEGQDVDVDVMVEYVDVDLRNGDEEEGFLEGHQTAVLEVFAKVTEVMEIDIVTDVIGEGVDVFKDIIKVDAVIAQDSKQVNVRENIFFNRPVKKIVETDAEVKINYTETKIIPDKVIIAGDLHKQVFFVDLCENAVFEQSFDEAFTTFIELPGVNKDMNLKVKAIVEDVNVHDPTYPADICDIFDAGEFDPHAYPWKQTAILFVSAKVTETIQMEVVTDVVAVSPTVAPTTTPAPTECPPSMKYHVVQKGDTFFKLAKKYNTTVEAIQKLNPGVDPKNLQIGQKIRIPCKPTDGAKG
ncbi:MAG: hypothetical protein PWQ96_1833 [Clostridia bacterium]|jgi:hypothetical protein|nr:Peptidoglycan-binding lysin domain protein [Clostridiales bacterium]MDK2986189.1 hypothetical protein [Clostridia bacterium]